MTGFGCNDRLFSASDFALAISVVMTSSSELFDRRDDERGLVPANDQSKKIVYHNNCEIISMTANQPKTMHDGSAFMCGCQ